MATPVPFCSPFLNSDPQLNAHWRLSKDSLLAMLVQISACRWWPCGLLQGWMVMSSAAATPDHAIFCTKRSPLPGISLTKHWTSGVEADVVLRDMGRVFDYSKRKQAAGGTDRELGSIAVTAKRLLSFACQVGWSAVSELLLPVASAMDGTASELVAELEDLADEGLTLLHQAVRSRNVDLVSPWHYLRRLTVLLPSWSLLSSCVPHGSKSSCSTFWLFASSMHAEHSQGFFGVQSLLVTRSSWSCDSHLYSF